MNRSLMIPGICCLVAFATVATALHVASGRETEGKRAASPYADSKVALSASIAPRTKPGTLLSTEDGQKLLTSLGDQYIAPWKERENSPYRLYSRSAPRPIAPISFAAEISPVAGDDSNFLLGMIDVKRGKESQPIACVVDRTTKEARFFADGRWLSSADWVKQAPLPK